MSTFKITLEVKEDFDNPVPWTPEILEYYFLDLMKSSILPTLNLNLTSSQVTKKRK